MGNMSYCRFRNTAPDVADCLEHLFDDDLSDEEQRARKRFIKLCQRVAIEMEDEQEGQVPA